MATPPISTASFSHIGQRDNQEDSCRILELPSGRDGQQSQVLLVVADGIGGYNAGEVASRLVVDTVSGHCLSTAGSPRIRLRNAVQQASLSVAQQGAANLQQQGMGSTVVAAIIRGDELTLAWMGDSRAYLLRAGAVVPLTRDHRGVAMDGSKVRGGFLVCWAGMGDGGEPDIRQIHLQAGDRVLLCTDGLNGLDPSVIASFGDVAIEAWPAELVQMALDRDRRSNIRSDNITVAAAQINHLSCAPAALPDLVPGAWLGDLQLVGSVGADRFHLWYLARSGSALRLLCILRPELRHDVERVLDLQEQEEALARISGPEVADVEQADSEKPVPYARMRLPAHGGGEDEGGSGDRIHSLDQALQPPAGTALTGAITPIQALVIARGVAGALSEVRASLLPAGPPHPSDFWGGGSRYALCRWPSIRRRFYVRTRAGITADPDLLPYRPPDQGPTTPAGPASDAYFVGCVLQRLLQGIPESNGMNPVVQDLLESLLAPAARDRPDAVGAVQGALTALGGDT